MQEQFAELVKGELKSELKLKVKGKLLHDTERLRVYLNKTQKQVIIQTTLACSPTVERELLQLQAEMAKVIGGNYSEIIRTFNKVQKTSKEVTDQDILDRV